MQRPSFLILAALIALLSACTKGHPFLSTADALYELNSGKALSAAQASRADGVYGTLQDTLFGGPQSISFVRFKPEAYTLTVVSAEAPAADSTSAIGLKNHAIAAINGSYFDMKHLTNATFIKDDGFIITATTDSVESALSNGAVFLSGGNLVIDAADTTAAMDDKWWEVMRSGPILYDDGVAATYTEDIPYWKGFYGKKHPRSVIGVDEEKYIWLIVADGRSEGNAEGMTIAELTELCRMIGLTDALNLDGGGSSTLWTLQGGVINHPSDNLRFDHEGQRVVPNILAVLSNH